MLKWYLIVKIITPGLWFGNLWVTEEYYKAPVKSYEVCLSRAEHVIFKPNTSVYIECVHVQLPEKI